MATRVVVQTIKRESELSVNWSVTMDTNLSNQYSVNVLTMVVTLGNGATRPLNVNVSIFELQTIWNAKASD